MKHFILLYLLLFPLLTFGNDQQPIVLLAEGNNNDSIIYRPDSLSEQPEPPGGIESFYRAITREVQYPETDKENGVMGKVYVQFIIEKNGELTDVKILRGVSENIDREAMRVIKLVGTRQQWKPGKLKGNPVRTRIVIPIIFHLS